jgi:putative transport protein
MDWFAATLGSYPEIAIFLALGMPVAYAVTYIFGTVGSAILLALIGPTHRGVRARRALGPSELHGPGLSRDQ